MTTKQLFNAIENNDIVAVKKWINRGVDVNERDKRYRIALHYACKNDCPEIVDLLIKAGANINAEDYNGFAALHWACLYNRLKIVKKLIKAKANLEAKDNRGRTALDIAKEEDYQEIIDLLEKFNKKSMSKKIGIGSEGKIHKDFANIVKQYEGYNKLDCLFWTYNASGEKRNAITGALLKAKGLACGFPDYIFFQKVISAVESEFDLKVIFIEFKAKKGKQSESQKEFEAKFSNLQNASYNLAYSVEDGINILIKNKIILE